MSELLSREATESEVAAAAKVIADSPLIDAPKLPAECWHGLARHILETALSPAREGWVSVPIEPTEEMIEAAIDRKDGHRKGATTEDFYGGIYKAMLSAAPEQQQQAQQQQEGHSVSALSDGPDRASGDSGMKLVGAKSITITRLRNSMSMWFTTTEGREISLAHCPLTDAEPVVIRLDPKNVLLRTWATAPEAGHDSGSASEPDSHTARPEKDEK